MLELSSLLQHYGYLAIFVGTFVEGESMLLLGSFAAHKGYLSMPGCWRRRALRPSSATRSTFA